MLAPNEEVKQIGFKRGRLKQGVGENISLNDVDQMF